MYFSANVPPRLEPYTVADVSSDDAFCYAYEVRKYPAPGAAPCTIASQHSLAMLHTESQGIAQLEGSWGSLLQIEQQVTAGKPVMHYM
jgi:hypothetical protein